MQPRMHTNTGPFKSPAVRPDVRSHRREMSPLRGALIDLGVAVVLIVVGVVAALIAVEVLG